MESALTKACTIKIQNFEGPFDLLCHLIDKNQVNIYDIPINEITDQYMDYLFAMQQMDLEIASEFLVMAANLLHIKSKLLLPEKKDKKEEEEGDPREQLVLKLIEYKRYKEFSQILKIREKEWEDVYYKLPEVVDFEWEDVILELSPEKLKNTFKTIVERNIRKKNDTSAKMTHILQKEKVSLKGKIREIVRTLINKAFFRFSELFNLNKKTKLEVITGFMAILELSKTKKVLLEQNRQFDEITVHRTGDSLEEEAGLDATGDWQ